MAKLQLSTKRLQIDKANTRVMIIVSVASFVTIFSLVSIQGLLGQRAYQARVIKEKQSAKEQLEKNVQAVNQLASSYQEFVKEPVNVIGGSSTGKGARDGDNAKLVLDALPSQYDFPALATSIEKILKDNNFKITSISGADDELAQNTNASAGEPLAVEMPYSFSVEGNYASMQNLLTVLERSIRSLETRRINFIGTDNVLRVDLDGVSYYQPGKKLDITVKDVK